LLRAWITVFVAQQFLHGVNMPQYYVIRGSEV
jgi:hypothetical protein